MILDPSMEQHPESLLVTYASLTVDFYGSLFALRHLHGRHVNVLFSNVPNVDQQGEMANIQNILLLNIC